MTAPGAPDAAQVEADARLALSEDLLAFPERGGAWPETEELHRHDPSLHWVEDRQACMRLVAKDGGTLCGAPWFDGCQRLVDGRSRVDWALGEGQTFAAGTIIARLEGRLRSLLLAERSALNFLQMLSGVATRTRALAEAVEASAGPVRTRLLDTRKTLPGLRCAQKYAVACGGGDNHRLGLYDAVMLKDNHLASIVDPAGGLAIDIDEWRRWRSQRPGLQLVIEVASLSELEWALPYQPDRVLLDNITAADLGAMVEKARASGVATEASGNIGIESIPACVEAGVDFISVGALTKNIEAIDFSLLLDS